MEPPLSFFPVAQVSELAPGYDVPNSQRFKTDSLPAKTIGKPVDVLYQCIRLLLSWAR